MANRRRTRPARAAHRSSASPKKASPRTKPPPTEEQLYERVAGILDQARGQVARSVNTAMVHAYWLVGREIIEVEQHGRARASYGEGVLMRLGRRLRRRFGKGFSDSSLRRMRQFFVAFPTGSKIRAGRLHKLRNRAARSIRAGTLHKSDAPLFPAALGWTHYLVLMRVANTDARAFYEIEAARERWSVPQLERQIHALLFERLTRHGKPGEVLALARDGQEVARPSDVIKDPFVLEFLDVREHPGLHERELEQAIIDRLESFLLEMGKGFCFVGRQFRLTIEGDHFYVDL